MAELMKTGEGRIRGVVTLNDSNVVIPKVVVQLTRSVLRIRQASGIDWRAALDAE